MVKLSLEGQIWNLEDGTTWETQEIFQALLEDKIDETLLCWNEQFSEKQPLSLRFQRVSRYGMIRELGEGTFGKVYLGYDIQRGWNSEQNKGRLVAIKKPTDRFLLQYARAAGHVDNTQKAQAWARANIGQLFTQEALLTARLGMCSYVVSVLDHDPSIPFIALEFCNEGSLEQRMQKPYTLEEIIRWGYEISCALAAAHSLRPDQMVHRDLKPDNILIDQGSLKIADFGGSKMIEENESLKSLRSGFTPSYAAPEAFDGKAYPATDVWSLGVIMYELLCGQLPFEGSMMQLMRKIATQEPISVTEACKFPVPPEVLELVEKCMRKNPKERPSALECLRIFNEAGGLSTVAEIREELPGFSLTDASSEEEDVADFEIPESKMSLPKIDLQEEPSQAQVLAPEPEEEPAEIESPEKSIAVYHNPEVLLKGKKRQEFVLLAPKTYSAGKRTCTVKEYVHVPTGMYFILILGGKFILGGESPNERPKRRVEIKPFLVSKYPVTQQVWQKIMGDNPATLKGMDRPIENVNWWECQEFCNKLHLSLPSEAQWEYACRAGTLHKYYWGDKMDPDYCWYAPKSEGKTQKVGQKKPNAFGLSDMSGNVWEWCEDLWHKNYRGAPRDGSAWTEKGSSEERVARGGSSWGKPYQCESAHRNSYPPDTKKGDLGLRVVKNLRR